MRSTFAITRRQFATREWPTTAWFHSVPYSDGVTEALHTEDTLERLYNKDTLESSE